MFKFITNAITNFRAKLVRKHRINEIVKTLQIAHASELAHMPGEQWPLIKERQAREILAVRDGNLDIVDRRSWMWPYLPETLHRIKQPIIKNLPYNVRRFARTPVPRRAINLIKNSIVALEWGITSKKGDLDTLDDDTKNRIAIATKSFDHPNHSDSFQSFLETAVDDFCINGAMVIEPQLTPDPERPFKMWTVDSSTIRIFPDWKESTPDQPHYAQMTGLKGERGVIVFYDNELIYMKDNPSVDSPFGLGKMEVAFQSVNAFVGVQEMAGRAGSDQIHKSWLWWPTAQAPHNVDIIRRHIMNDLEGQSKLSLVAGMQAPQVIEVTPVTIEDLLLPWQEMLIRMIGNGFDMSAMALNLERDVNRSTGEVLDDKDFRSAVLPTAIKIQEGFTRYILHRLLGWTDLEFKFLNLDDPDAQTKMTINQQLYAVNATTANEIRKSMGKPPLNNPFADLTQFELILINTEAAAKLQQQAADQQFQHQMSMMQPQMPEDEGFGGDGEGEAAAGLYEDTQIVAKNKKKKNVKAVGMKGPSTPKSGGVKMPTMPKISMPKLPKLPIAGSIFSAQQIAAMNYQAFVNAVAKGYIPKDRKFLAQEMEKQEPGILQELSQELQQYFEEVEDDAESKEDDLEIKVSGKDKEEQMQRFKKFRHQPSEIEQQVYNRLGDKDQQGRKAGRVKVDTKGNQFRGRNYNQGYKDQRSGTGKEVARPPRRSPKPRYN